MPSGVPMTVTDDGTYEVSFVVETTDRILPVIERSSGIDLGLTDFATIVSSDGSREKVGNPRILRKSERRLARAQKHLSRKVKGSKNREKARKRGARIHSRVSNSRTDFARKLARRLADENQVIVVESLSVSALARTRLAKSVHDAGWGTFLRVLKEMASESGRTVVAMPREFPSSQLCSACGVRDGKKPLSVREWTCASCGAVLDRDYNAALNLLAGGHPESLNACGADVRPRPTGAVSDEAGIRRTVQEASLVAA